MPMYPRDQFDAVPDDLLRVGAHRAPKAKGHGWIAFAWAALATGVLVAAGLYVISLSDIATLPGSTATGVASSSGTPTADPVTDPSQIAERNITITVLNGTTVAGLEGTAASMLTERSWVVGAQATASATDIEATTIYYSDAANEDVARGIALALGVGDIRLSDAFPGAPVTIVLGTDYSPTG